MKRSMNIIISGKMRGFQKQVGDNIQKLFDKKISILP